MSQANLKESPSPQQMVDPAQAEAEVVAALSDVYFREPVVDYYDKAIFEKQPGDDNLSVRSRILERDREAKAQDERTDHQWLQLTEAARRAVIKNPDARQAIATFTAKPLSELLPLQAVVEITEVDRLTDRVAKRMGKSLMPLLELKAVPDELIAPDITNAPGLVQKEDEIPLLARTKMENPEYFEEQLQEVKQRVGQHPGISTAERQLVARRYRYARDIKVLGLMAELHDHQIGTPEIKDGLVEHELPSGTKLVMTAEAFEANPNILDPEKWEKRRQIKDRVQAVLIDGKTYIIKDRKTTRHTDTKKNGHIDGATSREEFETAQKFNGRGAFQEGDVVVRWEKPLGYVEFPDGYQFTLFESDPDLHSNCSDYHATHWAKDNILNSPEEYQEEFEQLSQAARVVYEERGDLLYKKEIEKPKRLPISRAARAHNKSIKSLPAEDELTFGDFAMLKAEFLVLEARELLSQTMLDAGYTNSDHDGYTFVVHGGARTIVEIIGFDFEYYAYDPQGAARINNNRERYQASGEKAKMGLRFGTNATNRAIVQAAAFAMAEQAGWALPPG